MNAYVPIMILGAIGVAFAVFSVFIGVAIGPKRYNRAKLEAYECGIEPVGQSLLTPALRRGGEGPTFSGPIQRVPVKYYLTAMLFIIFDIEIVFLYPWAVAFDSFGWFGLAAMLLFIVNVSVAYAYEWRRGGLSWD
ncbi:NADH-quinone oxidoreductase subunit A [Gordonia alkanivorans]|uniref:NADH-quinone oxidoreductase subunit A n=2 Tax=Gordonia rubripertincta TaxID=36822 RepID=A0AAW6R8F7_GORRU|nr:MULTISPECIES: NADH-quinone oxidoreductase subunit A [Gordonia]ASR01126.1 NAD(P)H-quinone oxidoreductase subunit 3 [Gordonia rubripertincta]MBM7280136.1 NADH-quinone oxidoreductase subunit A [Gordonia rubripertincta]MDG6780836.1 NADH-quinone oxidoreductase subunit A [Gordonia rubripertincta]MDH3024175.1 NADH-quinone oxidoreductase subunit A [Gordonia alkanivorans]MDH3050687.1 NADH-quinone oxidoreductase subunit A [Gordonia alkanivorans]